MLNVVEMAQRIYCDLVVEAVLVEASIDIADLYEAAWRAAMTWNDCEVHRHETTNVETMDGRKAEVDP